MRCYIGSFDWKTYLKWMIIMVWFVLSLFLFGVLPVLASVILNSFTAVPYDEAILIEWETQNEVDHVGFYITRSESLNGVYVRLPASYQDSQSDETNGPYFYFFIDEDVQLGRTYFYKLEAINLQLVSQFFGPISATVGGNTPTPTVGNLRTSTPTLTSQTPSPTSPTGSGTVTPTVTFPPFPTEPGSKTLTPTTIFGTPIGGTVNPSGSTTPTLTPTLEPLPEIELIFPHTPTTAPTATQSFKENAELSTSNPLNQSSDQAAWRMPVMIGLIILLWVCLGAFLVVAVRKFGQEEV